MPGEPDSYLMLSRLPALRKAFQAAGRHIRSPGKRGLVVLMDDRFSSEAVRNLMPSWLRKDLVVGDIGPEALGSLTREFWSPQADHFSPPERDFRGGALVALDPLHLSGPD